MQLHLARAARALGDGGVIAYPTEAVWGLGCDPEDFAATVRLLALKQRPMEKGLILVAHDFAALRQYVEIPSNAALKRALASWPGPHTWVFPASDRAPLWITGAHPSIAVRVTAHPVAAALCARFGAPIVSTSANRAGQPPALSATQLRRAFRADRSVDAIMPGALGGLAAPTRIRNVVDGTIVRA